MKSLNDSTVMETLRQHFAREDLELRTAFNSSITDYLSNFL